MDGPQWGGSHELTLLGGKIRTAVGRIWSRINTDPPLRGQGRGALEDEIGRGLSSSRRPGSGAEARDGWTYAVDAKDIVWGPAALPSFISFPFFDIERLTVGAYRRRGPSSKLLLEIPLIPNCYSRLHKHEHFIPAEFEAHINFCCAAPDVIYSLIVHAIVRIKGYIPADSASGVHSAWHGIGGKPPTCAPATAWARAPTDMGLGKREITVFRSAAFGKSHHL
ncbi:hypothetical protein B0H16DRAFT_1688289 [Mycena metata]|uniref:Uncharacterized protein n=1 Tax=Mycena metata TaxID=1033252 RepID=A0AAD7JCT8_9AGAR|nr:hypothetical protein B0H16DRAFT_1688289 [Mycena metata]